MSNGSSARRSNPPPSPADQTREEPRMSGKSVVRRLIAAAGLAGCGLVPAVAAAQEVTLRAVNAFQEGTYFARSFEAFVKKVNAEGKGLVRINYVGGPKAIPPFEQANAIRGGVVDMANTAASFTASVVPEGMALNYTNFSMAELRKNGGLDAINKIYAEKNLFYFARTAEGIKYHLYSNKRIEQADLSGLKLRIAPIYREFFVRLGASVAQIAPGEVYTALERGVVDGYGWPLLGIFDLGWQDKTRFRLEPGFYAIEQGVVFNLNSWKKLSPEQRAFLEKQGAWLESLNAEAAVKDAEAEVQRQQAAGIQVLKLAPAEAAKLIRIANEAAWDGVEKASPANGAALRALLAPK
jgi:TRAP-type C4-dicarboxylate transport system substrate-binding protein